MAVAGYNHSILRFTDDRRFFYDLGPGKWTLAYYSLGNYRNLTCWSHH